MRLRRDEVARLAVEDTEVEAKGVEAGEQRPEQRADVQDPSEHAAVGERGADDRVLRPEAGEERDACERERADQERPARVRHRLRETAHPACPARRRRWITIPAARKRSALKKACVMRWKIANGVRADARSHGEEHVPELAHRGVREDALDVPLDESDPAGDEEGDQPEHGREVLDVGRGLEDEMRAADQVDARRDHRRRVDQGGDGCRALHRVRQPRVQRDLRRLGDSARQQAKGEQRHHRVREVLPLCAASKTVE